VSTDLYQTALVWYAQRGGVAKLWGRQVPLLAVPTIAGLSLVMIDYRPEIGERELQEATGPRRGMLPAEVAAADEFLRGLLERG
jgi:hypothetical protein